MSCRRGLICDNCDSSRISCTAQDVILVVVLIGASIFLFTVSYRNCHQRPGTHTLLRNQEESVTTTEGSNPLSMIRSSVINSARLLLQYVGLSPGTAWIDFTKIAITDWNFGEGGGGVVHRGMYLDRRVALKSVWAQRREVEDINEVLQEARMLKNVTHPFIVELYGLSSHEDVIYMVTEYAPSSLASLVPSEFYMPRDMNRIIQQLLCAICYLHSRNIAHRDLKPANILLSAAGDVRICDLGMATFTEILRNSVFTNGASAPSAGSPPWAPPEALYGILHTDLPEDRPTEPVDGKAWDVFSLGMVFWFLYVKIEPFFEEHPYQTIAIVRRGVRPSLESLPPALAGLIRQMWSGRQKSRPSVQGVKDAYTTHCERQVLREDLLRTPSLNSSFASLQIGLDRYVPPSISSAPTHGAQMLDITCDSPLGIEAAPSEKSVAARSSDTLYTFPHTTSTSRLMSSNTAQHLRATEHHDPF